MGKCVVLMSYEFWTEFLTEGSGFDHIECTKGLPDGATLVGSFLEEKSGIALPTLGLIFEHSDISSMVDSERYSVVIPSGERLPILDVEFKKELSPKEYTYTFTLKKPGHLRIRAKGWISPSSNTIEIGYYARDTFSPMADFPYELEMLC